MTSLKTSPTANEGLCRLRDFTRLHWVTLDLRMEITMSPLPISRWLTSLYFRWRWLSLSADLLLSVTTSYDSFDDAGTAQDGGGRCTVHLHGVTHTALPRWWWWSSPGHSYHRSGANPTSTAPSLARDGGRSLASPPRSALTALPRWRLFSALHSSTFSHWHD